MRCVKTIWVNKENAIKALNMAPFYGYRSFSALIDELLTDWINAPRKRVDKYVG